MFLNTRCRVFGCMNGRIKDSDFCAKHLQEYSKSDLDDFIASENEKDAYAELMISDIKVYSDRCEGIIKNNGKNDYRFIKVKASFTNTSGNTIETGDTYAVGVESLSPGESTSFTIYCNENGEIKSCKVTIYDYK